MIHRTATQSTVTIRNAFVTGTYRKHSVAGIPAFRGDTLPEFAAPKKTCARIAAARRLPTRLPSRVAPIENVLRNDVAAPVNAYEQLSLLFRYTSSPLRWEPINVHTIHRAIASPRSLFTTELRLQTRDSRTSTWKTYRYLPLHHALEAVDTEPYSYEGDCATRLTVIGRLRSCAELYGVFSPHLVGLEAGMLLSQTALMCSTLGIQTDSRVPCNTIANRAELGLEHWSDLPLATLRLYGQSWEVDLASAEVQELVSVEESIPSDVLEPYPSLRELVETIPTSVETSDFDRDRFRSQATQATSHAAVVSVSARGTSEPSPDMLEIFRRRSSGNDRTGFVPAGTEGGFSLRTLAATWSALATLQSRDELSRIDTRVYLAVIRASDAARGIYRLNLSRGAFELVKETDVAACLQEALTVGAYYNMREFSAAAAVTADYEAAIDTFGGRAFFAVLQACGQRLHQFGVAAAEQRMFSRPVKSYREIVLEHGLALEGQLVLLSLAGFNRKANPEFELL